MIFAARARQSPAIFFAAARVATESAMVLCSAAGARSSFICFSARSSDQPGAR